MGEIILTYLEERPVLRNLDRNVFLVHCFSSLPTPVPLVTSQRLRNKETSLHTVVMSGRRKKIRNPLHLKGVFFQDIPGIVSSSVLKDCASLPPYELWYRRPACKMHCQLLWTSLDTAKLCILYFCMSES